MKQPNKVGGTNKNREISLKMTQIAIPAFMLLSMGFNSFLMTNPIPDLNQNKIEIINKKDSSKNIQPKIASNSLHKGSNPAVHNGCSGCVYSCSGCTGVVWDDLVVRTIYGN